MENSWRRDLSRLIHDRFFHFEIAPLAVKALGAFVQGYIIGRLFVVGAQLGHLKRLIIVGGDDIFAFLDGFANRINRFIRHVGAHDHGPTAEVDGCDIFGHPVKAGLGHSRWTIAHRHHTFENRSLHRQETKPVFKRGPRPALDPLIEDRVDRAVFDARSPGRIAGPGCQMNFAAPLAQFRKVNPAARITAATVNIVEFSLSAL